MCHSRKLYVTLSSLLGCLQWSKSLPQVHSRKRRSTAGLVPRTVETSQLPIPGAQGRSSAMGTPPLLMSHLAKLFAVPLYLVGVLAKV
jgi:hypothetical protein